MTLGFCLLISNRLILTHAEEKKQHQRQAKLQVLKNKHFFSLALPALTGISLCCCVSAAAAAQPPPPVTQQVQTYIEKNNLLAVARLMRVAISKSSLSGNSLFHAIVYSDLQVQSSNNAKLNIIM